MTMPCPNFYILDEPTNHLDMETIEALGRALNSFRGGVILVSHNERFIRLVCRELWVCEGGGVTRVEGGLTSTEPSSRNSSAGRVSSRAARLRTVPRTWTGTPDPWVTTEATNSRPWTSPSGAALPPNRSPVDWSARCMAWRTGLLGKGWGCPLGLEFPWSLL